MEKTNSSDTLVILNALLQGLEDGYWQASTLPIKDRFYDLISAVSLEIAAVLQRDSPESEPYDPLTPEFRRARKHLNELRQELDQLVARTATAARLEVVLADTAQLFEGGH